MSKPIQAQATLRRTLYVSTALAGGMLVMAGEAGAQMQPPLTVPADVVRTRNSDDGAAPGVTRADGGPLRVELRARRSIIDWRKFDVPAGDQAGFFDCRGSCSPTRTDPIAILNRVVASGDNAPPMSVINGELVSDPNVSVFLINPTGILFGLGSAVNVGALIASTLETPDDPFLAEASSLNFAGPGNQSSISITGGSINAGGVAGLGQLVLLGAQVSVTGGTQTGRTNVAFVAGTDITVSADPTAGDGPLNFTINQGTALSNPITANGSISGRNVTLAFATMGMVTDAVLNVGGMVNATQAVATDRGVVLAADSDATGVDVVAEGANGDVRIGSTISSTQDVEVNAKGDIAATAAIEGRDVALQAGGAVSTAAIRARDDIAIRAGGAVTTGNLASGVALDTQPPESGAATDTDASGAADRLVAATPFMMEPAATLEGNDIDVRGATLDIPEARAAGDLRLQATAGDLRLGIGTAGETATVRTTGRGSLDASGDVFVTDSLTAVGDATVNAFDDARLARVTSSGGSIAVAAGREVTGTGEAGGAVLIANGGNSAQDVTVVATRFARLGEVAAARDVSATAGTMPALGDGLVVSGAVTAGRDVALNAPGGFVSVTGTVSAGDDIAVRASTFVSAPGSLTSGSGGGTGDDGAEQGAADALVAATRRPNETATALDGSDIDVRAEAVDLASATANGSASDLRLEATAGDLRLGTGRAGETATLTTSGRAALASSGDVIVDGSLEAGLADMSEGEVRISAIGDARLNSVTSLTGSVIVAAGDEVTGIGDAGANLAAASRDTDPQSMTDTGEDVIVTAGTLARLGDVVAGRDISVTAGSESRGGNIEIGSAEGRDIAIDARGGAATAGTLRARDDVAIRADAGVSVTGSIASGATIAGEPPIDTDGSGEADRVAGQTLEGYDIDVRGGSVSIENATAAAAGDTSRAAMLSDLRLTATFSDLFLGGGSAGGTAELTTTRASIEGSGDVFVRDTLTVGTAGREDGPATDVTVNAASDARLGRIESLTGSVLVAAGQDVTGFAFAGTAGAGDGLVVGNAAGGGTLTVSGAGDVRIGSARSTGGDVDVDAGGSVTGLAEGGGALAGGADLIASRSTDGGRDVTVRAGRLAILDEVRATRNVDVQAAAISMRDGSAGGNLTLSATGAGGTGGAVAPVRLFSSDDILAPGFGRADLTASSAAGRVTVDAGQIAQLGSVTGGDQAANRQPTAGDQIAVNARALTTTSAAAANGALTLTAREGGLYLGSGIAGTRASSAGTSVTLAKSGADESDEDARTNNVVRVRSGLTSGTADAAADDGVNRDLTIRSARGVRLNAATALGGSIRIDAGADQVDGTTVALRDGDVTGLLAAADTRSDGVDGAYGRADLSALPSRSDGDIAGSDRSISVNAGGVVQLGAVAAGIDVTVNAGTADLPGRDGGAIDITGVTTARGALALTAFNSQGSGPSGIRLGISASGDGANDVASAAGTSADSSIGTTATLTTGGSRGDILVGRSLRAGSASTSDDQVTIGLDSVGDVRLAGGELRALRGDLLVDADGRLSGLRPEDDGPVGGAGEGELRAGTINSGGDLVITSEGNIRLRAATSQGGDVTLDAGGSVTGVAREGTGDPIVNAGRLFAARDVTVTAGPLARVSATGAGTTDDGGTASTTGGNAGITADAVAVGSVSARAGSERDGDVTLVARSAGLQVGTVDADGRVTLSGNGGGGSGSGDGERLWSADDILAVGFDQADAESRAADGRVTVTAGRIAQLGIVRAGSGETPPADGAVQPQIQVTAQAITAGQATARNGALELTASEGGLYLGAALLRGGETGPSSAGTTATLTKSGAESGADENRADLNNEVRVRELLTGGTAGGAAGDVTVRSARDVRLNAIVAQGGSIRIDAGADPDGTPVRRGEVTGLLLAADAERSGGLDATRGRGSLTADGEVVVAAGTLVQLGPVAARDGAVTVTAGSAPAEGSSDEFRARDGAVDISSAAAGTALSLSAFNDDAATLADVRLGARQADGRAATDPAARDSTAGTTARLETTGTRGEVVVGRTLTAGTAAGSTGDVTIASATNARLNNVISRTGTVSVAAPGQVTGLGIARADDGRLNPDFGRANLTAEADGKDVVVTAGSQAQLGTASAGQDLLVTAGNDETAGSIDIELAEARDVALNAVGGTAAVGTANARDDIAIRAAGAATAGTLASGVAVGSRPAVDEAGAADTLAGIDLDGNDIDVRSASIDIASASASGDGSDLRLTATEAGVTLGTGSAAQDIETDAADGIVLSSGTAGRDVALNAQGGDIAAGEIAAGDDVAIRAVGAATAASLTSGPGTDADGAADTLAGGTLDGNDTDVRSASMNIGTAAANGAESDLRLAATEGGITLRAGSAGQDIEADAADGILLSSGTAGRDVALNARGGGVAAGEIGAGDDIAIRAAEAVTADSLTSGPGADADGAADTLAGGTLAGNDIDVRSASINIESASADGDVSDLRLTATEAGVTLGTGSAGQDIEVDAADGIVLGSGTAGRDVALNARGGDVAAGEIGAGDDLAIRAAGAVTADLLTSGPGTDADGAADFLAGEAFDGSDIDVRSARMNIAGATANGGESDLRLTATSGQLTLGTGRAGERATLIKQGSGESAGELQVGVLTSGTATDAVGEVTIVSSTDARLGEVTAQGGSIRIDAGADLENGEATARRRGDVTGLTVAADEPASGAMDGRFGRSRLTADNAVTLNAGTLVQLGQVEAGEAVTVIAGSAPVAGGAELAARDGAIDITTAIAGTALSLSAFNDDPASLGDVRIGTLDRDGVAVSDPDAPGSTAGSAASLTTTGTRGDVVIGRSLTAGGDVTLTSQAASVLLAGGAAPPGDFTVASGSGGIRVTAGAGVTGLSAGGGDIGEAGANGGELRAGTIDSGGDVVIDGAGNVRLRTARSESGSIEVTAGQSATGLADTDSGDEISGAGRLMAARSVEVAAAALARLSSVVAGENAAVRADTVAVGSASAGGDLTLDASGSGLHLGTGDVGGTTTLRTAMSGDDVDVPLTSADDQIVPTHGFANLDAGAAVSIAAGQVAQLGTVASGTDALVQARALTVIDASTAGSLTLTAGDGGLYLGTGNVGTTATLTKSDADGDGLTEAERNRDELRVQESLLAGGDIAIDSATDARLADIRSTGGSVTVRAARDATGIGEGGRALLMANASGQDVNVAAGGLARLGQVAAGRDVAVTADSIDLTTATAGRDAALNAGTGFVTAGQIGAGDDVVIRAAGAVTAGTLTSGPAADAVAVDASGAADTLAGTTLGGNDIDVRGSSIGITTATARGTASDLRLLATAGQLTLTTGSAGERATLAKQGDGGELQATTLTAGTAAGSTGDAAISSATSARLGDVTSRTGDITVAAARQVTGLAGAPATDGRLEPGFGRGNLTAEADGRNVTVTAGTIAQLGTAAAGRDLLVTAGNTGSAGSIDLTLGEARDLALNAVGGEIRIGTASARDDIAVRATGNVRAMTLASGVAVRSRPAVNEAGAADTLIGSGADAGGNDIDVRSASMDVTTATATGSGSDLRLTASSGQLTLGTGSAGATATLTKQGTGGELQATTLTAGTASGSAGDIGISSATGARLGDVTSRTGAVSVNAAAEVTGVPPAGSRANLIAEADGKDVLVTAGTLARLGTVAAGRDADLRVANGSIDVTLVEARDVALNAVGGNAVIGTANARDDIAVRATGEVTALTLASGVAVRSRPIVNEAGAADALIGSGADPAGNDIDVRSGSMNVTTASAAGAGSDLRMVAASGRLVLGTGTAGGTATLNKLGAGDELQVSQSLTASGLVDIDSATSARLNQVTSTAGSIDVGAAREVTGTGAANSPASLSAAAAGQDVTVDAGSLVRLRALTAGRNVIVTGGASDSRVELLDNVLAGADLRVSAGSVALGGDGDAETQSAGGLVQVTASTGTLTGGSGLTLRTNSNDTGGEALTLTANGAGGAILFAADSAISAGAGSDITIDTIGETTLGDVTAPGRTITVNANAVELLGRPGGGGGARISAANVDLLNRADRAGATALGDGVAGDFQLSQAELNRISANRVTVQSGSQNVQIGSLALGTDVGRDRLNLLTTGRVDVTGTVTALGTPNRGADTRTVQIGGTATSAGEAAVIAIQAVRDRTGAEAGGRLLLTGSDTAAPDGAANLELRGRAIAAGEAAFLGDVGVSGGGAGRPIDEIARLATQTSSRLYSPTGFFSQAELLTANTLTLSYSGFALFQNTAFGQTVLPTGVAVNRLGGAGTLSLSSVSPNANVLALFGSVNGVGGTQTALLGADVIRATAIDPNNSRINGCLVGSAGGGCLITAQTNPNLDVFDAGDADVLSASTDFDQPFEPIVGTSNEALLGGLGAADPMIEAVDCSTQPESPQCRDLEEEPQ